MKHQVEIGKRALKLALQTDGLYWLDVWKPEFLLSVRRAKTESLQNLAEAAKLRLTITKESKQRFYRIVAITSEELNRRKNYDNVE